MTLETGRITGNDNNVPTTSSSDPASTAQHTTATVPNSYPPQPLAGVHVTWGVIAKNTFSDTIFCDTNLTNYQVDVRSAAQSVYALWQAWANNSHATPSGLGKDVEIHWSIRLDNPTAPPPAMGCIVQAKMHMDGHLSAGNITSVNSISDPIVANIAYLQQIAKY